MLDKVYVDKSTGEQVRIINEDAINYVLDNSVRIKKVIFPKRYNEQVEVDPNSFFAAKYTSNDPLANLANQIKSLDSSKVSETGPGTQIKILQPSVVISDTSLPNGATIKQQQTEEPVKLSPEERKAMLEQWRKTQPGAQIPEVQQRNYEDEDEKFLNGDKPIVVKPPEPKVDPLQMMFKMFKNNYPVTINLKIEEKIPSPNFIGMVQENVEGDAIEYYSKIISDKFLSDPSKLKTEIYNQLKKIIDKELGTEEIVPTTSVVSDVTELNDLPKSGISGVWSDTPIHLKK